MALDIHRIGIGCGNVTMLGDILIEFDVHQPIFRQGVHFPRFCLAWFEKAQGFGYRHLIDE